MNPNNRRVFLKSSLAVALAASTPNILRANAIDPQTPRIGTDIKDFLKAIVSGEVETVRRMLSEDGKLIEARDSDGRSGYVLAVLSDHQDIAKLLTDAGYQTDLHEAALGLDWNRFEQLAEDAGTDVIGEVNRYHPLGGSAMFAAAVGGAGTDIWRVYAQCGLPNSNLEPSKRTPLQAALRYQDLEVAELTAFTLLSNSADPNSAAAGDSSPLHIATERGSHEMVEMLIRLGADTAAKNRDGKTCLEVAKAKDDSSLANLLENHLEIPRTHLDLRASVTREGEAYEEPEWDGLDELKRSGFVGSSHGNLGRVKELLNQDRRYAHSASTTGERAVEAGAHTGNRPIVEMLLDAGSPYSLPTAVMMDDVETTKRYLDQTPDRIHERGAHDFPLLWYPVIGRCGLEMLELLLDRGAKVEQQSLIGTTALHFACMRNDVATVELLIERGANVKRVGRKFGGERQTPLDLSRDKKIIDLLKANGA